MKTLAVRLEPELHAQLSVLAQLEDTTVTDFIRTAVSERIERLKAQPEIAAKADTVLAEIEADAASRRSAIAGLFGSEEVAEAKTAASPRRSRRTPPKDES